jgi:ATP-dependent DNA helicase RecQ
LDRLAIIQLSKEFGRKSTLRFKVTSDSLLSYFEKDMTASVIGKTILRLYGGIFESPAAVDLELVSKKSGQAISKIILALNKMERDQLLDLTLHITDASITFLVPREDDKTINVVAKEVEQLNTKKKKQVISVLEYIENTEVCRSLQLVNYFGEVNSMPCGVCSVCISEESTLTKKETNLIAEKIIFLLKEKAMSSREISENTTFTEDKIIRVLKRLIDNEKVVVNARSQYTIA